MNTVSQVVADVFDTRASLPRQVFRRSGELGFQLTDSANLTRPAAWEVFQKLAACFGDQRIVGMVIVDLRSTDESIQPLPFLDLSADAPRERYTEWLRRKGAQRSEPLYVDARTFVVNGGSGAWGLWSDQDRELAVLGVPRRAIGTMRDVLAGEDLGPWYEAAEVEQVLGPAFHPHAVPAALLREFRRSYAAVRTSSATEEPPMRT